MGHCSAYAIFCGIEDLKVMSKLKHDVVLRCVKVADVVMSNQHCAAAISAGGFSIFLHTLKQSKILYSVAIVD